MNYDTWKSTDAVADRQDGEDRMRLRLEEDERSQRWLEFTAWLRLARPSVVLRHVADLMDGQRDPYYRLPSEILDFQETEGWSGVLSVLARVTKEDGQ